MDRKQILRYASLLIASALLLFGCSSPALEEGAADKINQIIADGDLPAMQIAVVEGGELGESQAFGESVTTESVFMNGSVQKVFDAAAVLQLADEGWIDLEDDIDQYLDFSIRHPDYPETPITFRMLLAHRSGLDALDYQFSWDTECLFYPQYRSQCNLDLVDRPLDDFLVQSLTPEGINYTPAAWINPPGEKFHYSVSAFPLLRYLIEQVSGEPYPEYMENHIFQPLGMEHSGFNAADFPDQHSLPTSRLNGKNIALAVWNGNGYQMHTTAEDMAIFMLAMIQDGTYLGTQLLKIETVQLMETKISPGKNPFRPGEEYVENGYGLGLIHYTNGWLGHGGSTVGYQTLWMYNPSKECGFVIMTNINGILGGREDFDSIWNSVSAVRNLLFSKLHPLARVELFPHGFLVLMILISLIGITTSILRKRKLRQKE